MTIYSLYVFSKRGSCVYYAEWQRPRNPLADEPSEDRKLMFGLVHSLKNLMNKLSPTGDPSASSVPAPAAPGQPPPLPAALPPVGPDTGFFRVTASHYVLHHLETPTGYRFVATSDAAAGDLRPALWHVYEALFVAHALRNPMYAPGTVVEAAAFGTEVDRYVRSLPAFGAR